MKVRSERGLDNAFAVTIDPGIVNVMKTSFPSLPPEIEAAVAAQHGGPVAVPGQQGEHVVMSMAIFRDMMGVGDDAEFAKSVAGIKSSLVQAAVGQTFTLDETRQKLTDKYGP
jgi:hypothetical protein